MSQIKLKLPNNQEAWFDFEEFEKQQAFFKEREKEYWKWVETQPHLKSFTDRVLDKLNIKELFYEYIDRTSKDNT